MSLFIFAKLILPYLDQINYYATFFFILFC